MGKPLQQPLFNKINRAVRAAVKDGSWKRGKDAAARLAADFGVAPTTVRMVKRSKTWAGYQAELARRVRVPKRSAEQTLSDDLQQLENEPVKYVSVKQFEDALAALEGNIYREIDSSIANATKPITDDVAALQAQDKQDDKTFARHDRVINAIVRRKPRWFGR